MASAVIPCKFLFVPMDESCGQLMIDSDQEKDVRRHAMLTVSYALYGILGTSVLMRPKIRPKRAAALNKLHHGVTLPGFRLMGWPSQKKYLTM